MLTILFENKHFIAVNKPAGLVVHSDGKTKEQSLCDLVLAQYPQVAGVGEPMVLNKGQANEIIIDRPGVVHRLDRETTGVMIIAKTQEAFLFFKEQFQEREIKKIYHTIVWGIVKEDEGEIDRPIGRSKTDFRKWSAERFARGELRPAVTEYKVLQRVSQEDYADKGLNQYESGNTADGHKIDPKTDLIPRHFSYIEAYPKTGRTHQIRVHLKAINHSVVCDPLYAPNHPAILGFNRTALHAKQITITDPDGDEHTIEAPLPEDFKKAVALFS